MGVATDLSSLNGVWEIRCLRLDGADEARKVLERIARQVEPIMARRGWRVKLLSEMK